MAIHIGDSLGRYRILAQLGSGGMAAVYKAEDPALQRIVAIKVILQQEQASGKLIERFKREARALAQLTHPNIVRILDYGEKDGLPYLVMDIMILPNELTLSYARHFSKSASKRVCISTPISPFQPCTQSRRLPCHWM